MGDGVVERGTLVWHGLRFVLVWVALAIAVDKLI